MEIVTQVQNVAVKVMSLIVEFVVYVCLRSSCQDNLVNYLKEYGIDEEMIDFKLETCHIQQIRITNLDGTQAFS